MRNTARTGLKRAKIRMSMSKYNLYNITKALSPTSRYRTQNFFKQKWVAKSVLRDYHGEHVREKQWQRMFSRRLESVVPLDAAYLARNDGSIESSGRGSGLQQIDTPRKRRPRVLPLARTPFMLQTFAPLERRLDVAIFRALFASSARQARQFVIHGAVTVNGKPMRYPGYLLNPGDMFQVQPERVLFAMGAPKTIESATNEENTDQSTDASAAAQPTPEDVETEDRTPKEILKSLLAQSRSILSKSKEDISAKRKQDLRAFAKGLKRLMSKSGREDVETESVQAQFEAIEEQLRIARETRDTGKPALPSQQMSRADSASPAGSESIEAPTVTDVTEESDEFGHQDASTLRRALEAMIINPIDDSKPYATPWTPRDYLPAFAFIPRYLEVNQNICAAVYLRHPVAKPGLSEVPSPYPEAASANAFAWYLRRR